MRAVIGGRHRQCGLLTHQRGKHETAGMHDIIMTTITEVVSRNCELKKL